MSLPAGHIIKKQQVVVEFRDRKEGFGLQNQVADLVKEKLMPALGELFDELGSPGQYLLLDELMIDAGQLNSRYWEEELVEKTIRKIREELTGRINDPFLPGAMAGEAGTDSARPAKWLPLKDKLLYFLRHGHLPWNAGPTSLQQMQEEMQHGWQEAFAAQTGAAAAIRFIRQELLPLLFKEEEVMLRFLYQFTDSFIQHTLALAETENPAAVGAGLPSWVQSIPFLSAPQKKLLHYLPRLFRLEWQSVNGSSAVPPVFTPVQREELIRQYTSAGLIVKKIHQQHTTEWQQAARGKKNIIRSMPEPLAVLLEAESKILKTRKTNQPRTKRSEAEESGGSGEDGTAQTEKENLERNEAAATREAAAKKELPPEAASAEEGGFEYYVGNAGLVLLHPFLEPFFNDFGLLDEESRWKNEAACHRGLMLTQFLLTGSGEVDEAELPLNKILCGFPLSQTVEAVFEPTEAEHRERIALLEAVVNYWDALKGTSYESLINTFLVRSGKISPRESGWLLQVESRAWDIMLSQLPWAYSMIRHPWMNEMIYVEWH